MTREPYDRRDVYALQERLSARYPTDLGVASPSVRLWRALTEHTDFAKRGGDLYTELTATGEIHYRPLHQTFPKPTEQDLLDALALVDNDRYQVDRRERDLIDAALAADVSWQQIGVALGHTADTAEKAAKARRAQLVRQVAQHESGWRG